ncbi:MAG TPA: ATP-dependent DNA helicase, partial [Gammaproteobacteria bacterium]|nr:ATP-dependent DNA helicase [Gammaproteobacteria bacterium]
MQDYVDILGSEGPLAVALDDFTAREAQQAMAQAVAQAIEQTDTLVCEAGTGTGKTYAYLTPALLSKRRVILSTGTKHLQDQLYHRDLPVLRRALGSPAKVALLKGRGNYLCLHRFDLSQQENNLSSQQQVREFKAVQAFRQQTHSGDLGELEALAEDSPLRPQITSTIDNCLGSECPEYNNCFVLKARRNAQAADVVVVNHHLLLADMVLKQEGFGELLPGADAVVVDEAHQLPDLVGQYFGDAFSSRQVLELVRDTRTELISQSINDVTLDRQLDTLDKARRDARLTLGIDMGRRAWENIESSRLQTAIDELSSELEALIEQLTPLKDQSRGIDNCQRRAQLLYERLACFSETDTAQFVHWCEVYKQSFVFNRTPVQVAERFRERLEADNCAWIFASATLA